MVAKAFSAARSVSPTLSSRLTVRTAASTWVLSVRWRPRALSRPRSRNCASIASSRPCSSLPATRRARNSHKTEKSNPGSASSRPSAYFQSIRPRTASAAVAQPLGELQHRDEGQAPRGVRRLTAGRVEGGEHPVVVDRTQLVAHAHGRTALWERGRRDLGGRGGNRRDLGRTQRHGNGSVRLTPQQVVNAEPAISPTVSAATQTPRSNLRPRRADWRGSRS